MDYFVYILLIVMSYLYGSIPFALLVGKIFYNTDIRKQGSGNLGGSNAGRVLGKRAGISVIVLDASKCCISILIAKVITSWLGLDTNIIYPCALACMIGHCYPIFAKFKGGKGVASAIGYALMTNFYCALISLAIFLVVLKLTKYVSLASILGASSILITSIFIGYSPVGMITNFCIIAIMIYKHKDNIVRIKQGTENKIKWM